MSMVCWRRVAGMIAVVALLSGCGDRLKWTEDVRLPDGRTVTLTRVQEFNGPHYLFEEPTPSYHRFEFRNPDTGEKVRWEDDRDLATVALSINGGVPELLTTPQFWGPFRFRCPDPPYLAFRYVDDQWVRVPLTEMARKVVRPNMTIWNIKYVRPFIESRGRHMSADDVAAHVSEPFDGKTIDLTALKEQTFGDLRRCDRPYNWYFAGSTQEPSHE